mgnify:CR=1 FL=1
MHFGVTEIRQKTVRNREEIKMQILKHTYMALRKILTTVHKRKNLNSIPEGPGPELAEQAKESVCEQKGCYGLDSPEEDEIEKTIRPAANLPEGFQWVIWDDGSGHLQHPDGTISFDFDFLPYASLGGIEYRKSTIEHFSVFWGTRNEFFAYAEKWIAAALCLSIEK